MLYVCLLILIALAITLAALWWATQPMLRDFQNAANSPAIVERPQSVVTVILCVRGADPSLDECIQGLINQDYDNFNVTIVVDSDCDPGYELIRSIASESKIVEYQVLDAHPRGRGLKVSSILQAISRLPSETEVVAFVDADTNPHPTWLAELVAPLSDQQIGVTTGLRWFRPRENNWGSLIRAQWNLYASPMMRYVGIPWGGSFAMRRDILENTEILKVWQNKICEDTCLGDEITRSGYRIHWVPSISMINDEKCTISGAMGFIIRQTLFARLHTRNWLPMMAFSFIYPSLCLSLIGIGAYSFIIQDWNMFLLSSVACLALYAVSFAYEYRMCRLPEMIDPSLPRRNYRPLWKYVSSRVMTLCVFMMACYKVAIANQMTWRGITYRFRSRNEIEMLAYAPFRVTSNKPRDTHPDLVVEELSI